MIRNYLRQAKRNISCRYCTHLMDTITPSRPFLCPPCIGAENDNTLVPDDIVLVKLKQMGFEHPLKVRANGRISSPEITAFWGPSMWNLKRVIQPFCETFEIQKTRGENCCFVFPDQWVKYGKYFPILYTYALL